MNAKRFVQILLFVGATTLFANIVHPQQPLDSASLLDRAIRQSDIRATGSPPFRLLAVVHLPVHLSGTPLQGTFELLWASKSQWRERIDFGDYRRTRFGGEEKYWQLESLDHEPWRMFQLDAVLAWNQELRGLRGLSSKAKVRGGSSQLACFTGRDTDNTKREVCVNPSDALLASITETDPGPADDPASVGYEFSKYGDWQGKRFPGVITLVHSGSVIADLEVQSISPLTQTAPSDFSPPPEALEFSRCTNMHQFEKLRGANPAFSPQARAEHAEGSVDIYLVVEPDGTVRNLSLARATGTDLDRVALDAVRKWTFKPATCAGVPVRSAGYVEVTFATRP